MVRDGKTCLSFSKDSLSIPKGMTKAVRMYIALLDANMALFIGIVSVVGETRICNDRLNSHGPEGVTMPCRTRTCHPTKSNVLSH